ncbi:hypothetical protein [Methylobacterium currus]|nr:hypothetical protein [Methylobacterium currus]
MSISYDELWPPGPEGRSHVRRVYRGGESIGRVRRRPEEPGELTGE